MPSYIYKHLRGASGNVNATLPQRRRLRKILCHHNVIVRDVFSPWRPARGSAPRTALTVDWHRHKIHSDSNCHSKPLCIDGILSTTMSLRSDELRVKLYCVDDTITYPGSNSRNYQILMSIAGIDRLKDRREVLSERHFIYETRSSE